MRRVIEHGSGRGLCGVLLFAALTGWTLFVNPSVFAGGGGNSTVTTTASTTSHTTSGCPSHTETAVTTQTTFGPATILIGENQSQTFFVAAGTINVNTNTHTETFICTALAPLLAPGALAACAVMLVGVGVRRLRRRTSWR